MPSSLPRRSARVNAVRSHRRGAVPSLIPSLSEREEDEIIFPPLTLLLPLFLAPALPLPCALPLFLVADYSHSDHLPFACRRPSISFALLPVSPPPPSSTLRYPCLHSFLPPSPCSLLLPHASLSLPRRLPCRRPYASSSLPPSLLLPASHKISPGLLNSEGVTGREKERCCCCEQRAHLVAASDRIQEAVSLSPMILALPSHGRMSYVLMSRTLSLSSNSDSRACPMMKPM